MNKLERRRRVFSRLATTAAVIVPAVVVLLILSSAAWADRAGGGGGYSGSGDGSGGGGGGELIFWLIYILIRLCIEAPAIGIPLTLTIIAFFIWVAYSTKEYRDNRALRRGDESAYYNNDVAATDAMRAADPAFDRDAFVVRVKIAFEKIQKAWCDQNLASVRPFISDGIYERFTLQVQETRDRGLRDRVDDLLIHSCELAQTYADGIYDVLAVRITASARAYEVSLADGSYASGDRSAESFVEYWSFIRRRGAKKSLLHTGLIEGNCPNCGAAIAMNQNANCPSCKAMLLSGEYDWALAEITQECEWRGARQAVPLGVADLRSRDPEFNLQHLEDRASVIFWRRAMAERTGNAAILRKVAFPELARRYEEQLNADRAEPKPYFMGDCAVGAVNTLGIVEDDGWTRALIEVRWEGERFNIVPGNRRAATGQRSLFRTLFVLTRRRDSTSAGHSGLSSAHCPSCGAPESASASNACEYCGAVLNDGSRSWVLYDAMAMNSSEANPWLARVRKPREAAIALNNTGNPSGFASNSLGSLQWVVQAVTADREITDDERDVLADYADQCGVHAARLEGMIEASLAGRAAVARPNDAADARAWVIDAADIALADGKLTRDEYKVLARAGLHGGLSDYDVRSILKQRQSDRVRESRQQIRLARRLRRANGKR